LLAIVAVVVVIVLSLSSSSVSVVVVVVVACRRVVAVSGSAAGRTEDRQADRIKFAPYGVRFPHDKVVAAPLPCYPSN
jgi:hypothetical protein